VAGVPGGAEHPGGLAGLGRFLLQLCLGELHLLAEQRRQVVADVADELTDGGLLDLFAVVLLSFALVFALGNVMDLGWAALIVAVLWGIVGAVLFASGRKKLKTVDPVPHRTVDTLKEDAQWLKNPTG